MADISTFELLVKRIAPVVGDPLSPLNAPFRRVVQGYFLTISNPNDTPVYLRVRVRFPVFQPPSPDTLLDRELIGGAESNHIYTYDITGGLENGQIFSRPLRCRNTVCDGFQRTLISDNLFLPQCQTAAFKLLPNLGPNTTINIAEPRFEVRGYIEIVQLQTLIIEETDNGEFVLTLTGTSPLDMYMTPEIRGTFLDNAYPDICAVAASLDFDQIAYSIPTVPGGARIRLEEASEPFFQICGFFPIDDLEIGRLTGRVDMSNRFLLDNSALSYLEEKIEGAKRQNDTFELSLSQVRDMIEKEVNTNGVIQRKG